MNKRLKKLLTILPLFAAGIATPIALTSCGSTSSISPDVGKPDVGNPEVEKVTFKAEQPITNTRKTDTPNATDRPTTLEVLDPNVNADAQQKAEQTFKTKLTKENLQTDMDEVLFKFFKTYEFESETETPNGNDNELEAEVQKIEVLNVDEDLNANLNVTFKVTETKENNNNDDEKDEKEGEIVTTREEVQPKTLKLTPRFATITEIKSITQMLQKADEIESDDLQYEADLDDLIKLYIGDKEDDEKSIFGQVGLLTTNSKYGGLLGYGIKISDLAYDPNYKNPDGKNLKLKANRITGDETIFAPSAVITDFYVPSDSVTTADGFSITIDYTEVSKHTKEEILAIEKVYKEETPSIPTPPADGESGKGYSGSSTLPDGTSKEKLVLNDILVTPIKKEHNAVSVKIHDNPNNQAAQNFLLVDITFKTTPDEADDGLANITVVRISIDGNWLAPSTPTQQK